MLLRYVFSLSLRFLAMIVGVLLLVGTGLAWAFVGVVLSWTAKAKANIVTVFALQMCVAVLLASSFFPDYAKLTTAGPDLWKMMAIMLAGGALSGAGMLIMQRAMSLGHHGITWSIGQSALVIPFLVSVVLFHEPLPLARLTGVLAIVCSLMLLGIARQAGNDDPSAEAPVKVVPWIILALITLIVLGAQQTLVSVPSQVPALADTVGVRIPLIYIGSGLVYGALWLRRPARPARTELLIALVGGPINVGSQLLFFSGLDILAKHQAASIGFPIAVGTCILGFVAYSFVIIGEKFTPWHVAGISLGLLGIVTLSI